MRRVVLNVLEARYTVCCAFTTLMGTGHAASAGTRQ